MHPLSTFAGAMTGWGEAGPAARWRRLGAALGLSLALHLAVVLALLPSRSPRPAAGDFATPLVARLVEPAAPAPPPPAVVPTPRSTASSSGRPAKAAPPPVTPASASTGRVAYVTARTANYDVPPELFGEKLREAQRRVPRSIDLARQAKLVGSVRATYPAQLLARGEKGYVLAEVFVSAGGRVDEVAILEHSGSPELSRAAAEALRRARFRAAEGASGKTRSRITVRVDFSYE